MTSIVTAEKLLKNVLQEENDKKETKIVPKDFYWDQIIFYLVSAILGLSFLDISVEFFRGSTVQCYIRQDDSPNRDHFTYINSYCHRSLSVSQYYLIFLLIAAVFILAPHYLWTSYFGKHFDFFFDLLKHLDRLHDPDTGEYDPLNFAYIEKLEERFSADSETGIFKSYQLKLFVQLMACVLGMLMNFLYFSSNDFDAEFVCDVKLNSSVWIYDDDIYCVYNSLRLLWFLWIVAGILIGLAFFSLLFGLAWCFTSHGAELGAKPVAHFCYQSCLLPDKHVSSSLLSKLKGLLSGHVSGSTALVWCWKFIKMQLVNYRRVIQPQIQSDLEFLLMKLFYADSGHGQVFRDIQINKELQTMFEQDHELLHLLLRAHADMMKQQIKLGSKTDPQYNRSKDMQQTFFEAGFKVERIETVEYQIYSKIQANMGIDERDWSVSPFRNMLYGFLSFVNKNKVALDIAFETKYGYSLILARAFSDVTTVYFDRYFRNRTSVALQKKYAPNYDITTYPDNIFSYEGEKIADADGMITDLFETEDRSGINLIMIGPITDRPKIISTNLLVNKVYENRLLSKRAVLIAVRPLMIGERPVLDHFQQFNPPEGLFDSYSYFNCDDYDFNTLLQDKIYCVHRSGVNHIPAAQGTTHCINGYIGIEVMCDSVRCVFEFRVYKYKGRLVAEDDDSDSDDDDSNDEHIDNGSPSQTSHSTV